MAPFIEQLTNKRSWLIVETSRGCPYKCSFCDWGGGTYTKTVKKDFATVLDEISWAGENQIDAISFTDANFGIFNIDLEYIKHCVETKKIYDYPKQILIQPTKTKIDQLTKIYMLLAENDMLSHYQIAIQDINDDVKKNVDRIDFPFEDQVNMFKKLQEKKYFPIWIESIIGLPGSSIDTVKEGIQRISLVELSYPLSHHWVMLPATPAAAPTYRKKFKLITVHGKSSIGVGTTRLINAKPGRQQDPGVSVAVSGDEITGEYVVGTFSYTPNDWVDMNLLQIFTATTQNGNILSTIADYMWNIHNTHYGDFFYTCLHTILFDTSTDPNLQKNFNILKLKFQEWLQTDCPDLFVDFHNELNFTIAPSIYYVLITLLDSKSFFNAIRIAIAKLVPMDEKIEDLCYFSQQRLLDIDYTVGRTFTTQYDWPKYIELGILDKTVKSFELADTQIQTGGRWFDIDWNQYQGVDRQKQFIYRVCFDFKGTKISRQIKEMPKN
jgi:putative methyltransferase